MAKSPEEFAFTIAFADFDTELLPDESCEPGSDHFRTAATAFLQEQYKHFGGKARIVVNDNEQLIEVRWTPDPAGVDPKEVVLDLLNRGQYEKAIPLLWTLMRQHPDDPQHPYNLGMAYSELGQLDKAQHCLQDALRISPDHVNAQVALAVAQKRAGDGEAAMQTLRSAINTAPDNPWALQNLGGCLLELGQVEEAEKHLRKSVSILPTNPQATYGLARALEMLGKIEEADKLYVKTIDIGGHHPAVEAAKQARTKLAHASLRSVGVERMDAVMYCLGALETFDNMTADKVRAIGFEIAVLGTKGLDINDSSQKYKLKSLPGSFSGLHLLCYMYVAFQQIAPGQDVGIDFSREYDTALSMFKKRQ